MTTRKASHAGSWYSSNSNQLAAEFNEYLANVSDVKAPKGANFKALIGPHAGYRFCGQTAAYAYAPLAEKASQIKRVFVLGPSHHIYLDNTSIISCASSVSTPFGPLAVDKSTISELQKSHPSLFQFASIEDEEEEHSLEMHFPWIAKCIGKHVQVVPIIVGNISFETSKLYGSVFAKYFEDESTFFVISSDFCHWGKRFKYTYYDNKNGPIFKSIEALDKQGIQAIESMKPEEFNKYMVEYKNTICGRNPILVTMHIAQQLKGKQFKWSFEHYSQSNKVMQTSDSSVSYASGLLYTM